jgi:hypothetical protein
MAIIISKRGKNARKIDKMSIPKEDFLQRQIYENPECIPLYEYKEGVQLLILAREFPSGAGPIDALGIDKDGEIYLVETKLYKNPDKRLVVAQVLDYGAGLWQSYANSDNFIQKVDEVLGSESKTTVQDRIKEFFDLDDQESDDLVESVKRNLHDGRFKFVVLMDRLYEQLKDLIAFIDENSNFSVFAVELEYYEHENQEILIPKLFGAKIKNTGRQPSDRLKWDEEKFLQKAREQTSQSEAYSILEKLLNFTKGNSDKLDWGTGAESGSFTFKLQNPKSESDYISLFTVWTSGNIRFRFQNIRSRVGDDTAEMFREKLLFLPVAKRWKQDDIKRYGPGNKLGDAFPDEETLKSFEAAILQFKDKVNRPEKL